MGRYDFVKRNRMHRNRCAGFRTFLYGLLKFHKKPYTTFGSSFIRSAERGASALCALTEVRHRSDRRYHPSVSPLLTAVRNALAGVR